MAKKGRLTPDKWGAFMPVQSPIHHKGPWYYRDTECMVVEFPIDPDSCLDLLPSDIELFEPATGFLVIEMNHRGTVGSYNEVYNGILCNWQGQLHAFVPGVFVTTENAQVLGREIWGFGKKRAHRIELIHHGDSQIEAAMDINPGDQAIRAFMRPAKNEKAESIGTLPLICLRVIPDPEGSNRPSLAQLISVFFKAQVIVGPDGLAEAYSGTGHIQFGIPSDAQLPMAGAPSFKYGRFTAVLPYGKVLKTYSDKELPSK